MKKMKFQKVLMLLMVAFCGAILTGCSDDKDDLAGDTGELTVNGVAWTIAGSAPNFSDESFCYFGNPKGSDEVFLMLWDEGLEDVEVGEDMTCDLAFPLQDLNYEYTDGEIIVKKVAGARVVLEFVNVKYHYKGSYMGLASSERNEQYQPDNLTINGTVEFIHNQPVVN